MATPGQLIATVAQSFGLPEKDVAYPYRVLREARLVTKGKRGYGAARSTPLDGSRLAIALCATRLGHEVLPGLQLFAGRPATYNVIRGVRYPVGRWRLDALPDLKALPEEHSFGDALALVFAAVAERQLDPSHHFRGVKREAFSPDRGATWYMWIRFEGPYPQATIRIFSGMDWQMIRYGGIPKAQERYGWAYREYTELDLFQRVEFSSHTIVRVGQLLSDDLRPEHMPEEIGGA